MLANIVAGVNRSLELDKKTKYVLVASSDIPTLRPEMVDWLVDNAMQSKDDLYYGVCPREVMEKRFPDSKRTFTKLKDIELCGADVNIAHVRMATEHLDTWESLIGNRKSPFKQAMMIGLGTLFQVVTRSITLEDLTAKVCKRIGVKGRVIIWPYAEACMDVDKPHQLEMLRADLEKQQKKIQRQQQRTATKPKTTPVKKKAAPVKKSKPATKLTSTKAQPKKK
jgi:hypothetical protein